MGAHFDHTQRLFGGLYHCAKFGCSSLDSIKVSIFGAFDLKNYIHAPPQKKIFFCYLMLSG